MREGAIVSILARPEGRALQPLRDFIQSLGLFQSSPAPKDGRYKDAGQLMDELVVSILARPEGRALLLCVSRRGDV